MRHVQETLDNMGPLSETDIECVHTGYSRGNYANAYETQDYDTGVRSINGSNGFYRIGFLLGFFASYENYEAPMDVQEDLKHYRAVSDAQGWGLA